MYTRITKSLRVSGILLGLIYFYWGITTWETVRRMSHPILGISLTFLYAIMLVAPWTYLARLRVWIFLYVFFVIFSLWMILSHLIGLYATLVRPQIIAVGILALLIIEISQIPVLWIMRREEKGGGQRKGSPIRGSGSS